MNAKTKETVALEAIVITTEREMRRSLRLEPEEDATTYTSPPQWVVLEDVLDLARKALAAPETPKEHPRSLGVPIPFYADNAARELLSLWRGEKKGLAVLHRPGQLSFAAWGRVFAGAITRICAASIEKGLANSDGKLLSADEASIEILSSLADELSNPTAQVKAWKSDA